MGWLVIIVMIVLSAGDLYNSWAKKTEFKRHMAKMEQEDIAEIIASWAEDGELKGLSGAEILTAARSELQARSRRLSGARSTG